MKGERDARRKRPGHAPNLYCPRDVVDARRGQPHAPLVLMCTLIAFHQVWNDAPLVVATNRDEAYDRPSAPPRWLDGEPAALAPLDERAGGTWMGANERGLWVGLTNRRAEAHDPCLRSRGLLCRELLGAESAVAAVARLESLDERYNPFHVVVADPERMVLVEHEAGRSAARRLPPGCHLVTNRPFDETPEEPKARRAWRLLYRSGLWPVEGGSHAPPDLESRLTAVLGDHGEEGRDAICLHGGRYGTKSAAVWRISPSEPPRAARVTLAFAAGPPCSTAFSPLGQDESGRAAVRVDGVESSG